MPEYEEILRVKEEAEASLRSLPGVHAIGIGNKVIHGKNTEEIAIAAFVIQKKPLSELASNQAVPGEISGIKTDVVEMPIFKPHFAANPTNVIHAISNDHKSISFSGTKNVPGDGLVITVEFTATPSAEAPPNFAITYETQSIDTLENIIKGLSAAINHSTFFTHVTAKTTLDSLVVAGEEGTATIVAITSCTVDPVDDKKYFKDWVRGGIQIQIGGDTEQNTFGTLGCLATTKASAEYPQGKVVGITCHHIMEPSRRKSTNLIANKNGAVVTLSTSPDDNGPIPAGTVLKVSFPKNHPNPSEVAYYQTINGDTLANISQKINDAINTLPFESSIISGPTAISITGGEFTVSTFGQPADSDSKLKTKVEGQVITFNGSVDDEGYGIFVDLHPGVTYPDGAIYPSYSVFYTPPKKTSLENVAKNVAQAINDFDFKPEDPQAKVTASQGGAQVTVHNVKAVECTITSDIRVGQPDASFCSHCSQCCSNRIGVLIDSRMDIDIALIQLDAGLSYKPEVQDINLVEGSADPKVGMAVVKRGRSTRITNGTVKYTAVSGTTGETLRQFNNAFLIRSKTTDPFSSGGDSGAAVLNSSNQVVGIVFAGANLTSLATPWNQIVAAFPELNPNPSPAAGQAPDAVRTVPKSALQMTTLEPNSTAVIAAKNINPALSGRLGRRIEEAEREITTTSKGREYASLVRHHFPEAHSLITTNRRVGAAWQRNGGPKIIEAAMKMLQLRDQRLPDEINGKPLIDCLAAIKSVLTKYSSTQLASDLTKLMPQLGAFAGYSYNQLLSALQSEGTQ